MDTTTDTPSDNEETLLERNGLRELRRVFTATFTIPFGGGPAEICERELRSQITRIAADLPDLHPDIRVSTSTNSVMGQVEES